MKNDKKGKIVKNAIDEYSSNGVCVVKDLLKEDEIKHLQQEASRLWSKQEDLTLYNLRVGLRKGLNGEDVLERLDPVVDISKIFSDINGDERILKLAQDALGEAVMVLKEKLIYKWPGNSGYGAHRDEPYFRVLGEKGPSGIEMVSIAVALDKTNSKNGAIKFYPNLRFTKLSSPKDEPRDIDKSELENIPAFMPDLDPGDIVLFDGIIPHASDFNRSDHPRRIYIITFVPKRYIGSREDYYRLRHDEFSKKRKKDYGGDFYIR